MRILQKSGRQLLLVFIILYPCLFYKSNSQAMGWNFIGCTHNTSLCGCAVCVDGWIYVVICVVCMLECIVICMLECIVMCMY